MSLNHDYAMQIISDQKLQDFRAEAAGERLARIARSGRRPWWQRLLEPAGGTRRGAAANGARAAGTGGRGPRLGTSSVAR